MRTREKSMRGPRSGLPRSVLGFALALTLAHPTGVSPARAAPPSGLRVQAPRADAEPPAPPDPAERAHAAAAFGRLPLRFEPNLGQASPDVQFLARGSGYALALTPAEAVFAFGGTSRLPKRDQDPTPAAELQTPPSVLRMQLRGANPAPQLAGEGALPGVSHYYLGGDPSRWRTNVPAFAAVRYAEVYPGVDLLYYGAGGPGVGGDLEYDFVLAPGADPRLIRLRFEGAERVRVDAQGELVREAAAGGASAAEVRQKAPALYQEDEGGRRQGLGRYEVRGEEVGFAVGAYDSNRPLVIDPVLAFSTYLGGNLMDEGAGIAVDASGSAYVTGATTSTDFPTRDNTTERGGGVDAFVTKLNATGTDVIYSLYLGGTDEDRAFGVALDGTGGAYVAGHTSSADFPTSADTFQRELCGRGDAFVTQLDAADGHLLWSTYFGGRDLEYAFGLAADGSRGVYLAGETDSDNLPLENAYQAFNAGGRDAFVAKLSPSRSGRRSLLYATYLGGGDADQGSAVAVDGSGHAHIAGRTNSTDFPVLSAFQENTGGGYDAFVAELDLATVGSASLLASSYLGGGLDDSGADIAVDDAGSAYVVGTTRSSLFPTVPTPFQDDQGGVDAFVTKISTAEADLTLTTRGAPDPAPSGGHVTFTLTVSNAGPSAAEGVVLADPTPAGTTFASAAASQGSCSSPAPGTSGTVTCALGTLAAGESATVTIVLNVTAAPGATVTNTATVRALAGDPNRADNTASDTVAIVATTVPPDVTAVERLPGAFRLRVQGTNFQPGVTVFIGGDATPWPAVRYGNSTALTLRGGPRCGRDSSRACRSRSASSTLGAARTRRPSPGEAGATNRRQTEGVRVCGRERPQRGGGTYAASGVAHHTAAGWLSRRRPCGAS
jgi:uncharacterized repeat protein (TIGR01451 family)